MKEKNKNYSPELSEKTTAMMRTFLGRNMSEFPIPCMTKWIGVTLIEVERGVISFQVTATRDMTNPAGHLHGGLQCAMLDDAMGWACATLGYEQQFLTTNINVDYLGTAKSGDTIKVRAWIYREGSTMLHVIGEVTKDDRVIAKGQSNVIITKKQFKQEEFNREMAE